MTHRIHRVSGSVAPTPLVGRYGLFAERVEVRTDDPRVLVAAEASFQAVRGPGHGTPLVVRLRG
jgi:hypothetical protein